MRSLQLASRLLVCSALVTLASVSVGANLIEFGGISLRFSVPSKVQAYDVLTVRCELTGKGDIAVQAVATNSPACAKYFDSALPHKIAYRFEYLKEDLYNGTVRITNIGDTIWKANGYGETRLGDFLGPYVFLGSDLVPGESVTRDFPMERLRPEKGRQRERVFALVVDREDSRRPPEGVIKLELPVAEYEPGFSTEKEGEFSPKPLLDSFDEFGHAFALLRSAKEGGRATARLNVQVPPWADRLVIRLIKDGAMKSATIPLSVSQDSLRLDGKPTTRWTIDGKPIFVESGWPQIGSDEIPSQREKMGGDNVVLVSRAEMDPNSNWLRVAKEKGIKTIPISIGYVRLQGIGRIAGVELMPGAPPQYEIERVDALDPNFPKAMADVVDKVYAAAKNVLYRTADGKIPMCLSEEQSYGYPWAEPYPPRWGGGTPQDVAAFRVSLREKYGTIESLNKKWKTAYKSFEEIDPSPICSMGTAGYPDPWKEWGPAIEDFDVFRSKIHGEFWARTCAEIKKRHPDIICGLNVFGDYASETEPIYEGFYNWRVKDYQGKGVNWLARRIGCLPDDLMCFDFLVSWNTGSPEAAKKNLAFWHKRGKDVIIYARNYDKMVPGGDKELQTHAPIGVGVKGISITQDTSFFTMLKATYEAGGIPGLLNDAYVASKLNDAQRREIVLFNQEVARASASRKAKAASPP